MINRGCGGCVEVLLMNGGLTDLGDAIGWLEDN
jgi:hypothetical protein